MRALLWLLLLLFSPLMPLMPAYLPWMPPTAGVWVMLAFWAGSLMVFLVWLFDLKPALGALAVELTTAPPGQVSTVNGLALSILVTAVIAGLIALY